MGITRDDSYTSDDVTVPGQSTKFVVSCLPRWVAVVDNEKLLGLCASIDDLARNESWTTVLLHVWRVSVDDTDFVQVSTRHSWPWDASRLLTIVEG